MIFTNKVYDVLKWIAQILLPAVGTLYYAVAGIWGLPYAEQIVGSILAVDAFLGILLGLTSVQYNKNSVTTFPGVPPVDTALKTTNDVKYAADLVKNKDAADKN
jgi:hypothetical protein